MSRTDLKTLVTEIQVNKAEAQATKEALTSERQLYGQYENSVNKLIDIQEKERQAAMDVIKQLKRQLNAPALEIYTGYNVKDQWEGGIRLIWRLN